MAIDSILPVVSKPMDFTWSFPDHGNDNLSPAGVYSGDSTNLIVPEAGTSVMWGAGSGVGARTMELVNGVLCAQFVQPRFEILFPYPAVIVRRTDLPPGFKLPSMFRVWRLTLSMAQTGLAAETGGVGFAPSAIHFATWPTSNGAAFGVAGDGVNGWKYWQSDAGVFPGNVTEEVAIGAAIVPDVTEFNTFVFEIINSGPGRDASMSLTVNGTLIVSRNWQNAPALPDYGAPVNANKMSFGLLSGTVGEEIFIGPTTVEMGRFTRDGLEVLF